MLLVRNMLNADKKPINLYLNTMAVYFLGESSTLSYFHGHVAQYGKSVTVIEVKVIGSNPIVSNIIKRKYIKESW